jgi:hypothetical protein
VLSSFDEVKLGVAYKVDGEVLPFFPASLEVLGKVEVVYETYPGWKCDITKAKSFEVRSPCNPFIYVSIYLSTYLSIYLFIYLFILELIFCVMCRSCPRKLRPTSDVLRSFSSAPSPG